MRAVNRQPWFPRDRLVEMVRLVHSKRFVNEILHKSANFADFADFPVFMILATNFGKTYTDRDPKRFTESNPPCLETHFPLKTFNFLQNRPFSQIFDDFLRFSKIEVDLGVR